MVSDWKLWESKATMSASYENETYILSHLHYIWRLLPGFM